MSAFVVLILDCPQREINPTCLIYSSCRFNDLFSHPYHHWVSIGILVILVHTVKTILTTRLLFTLNAIIKIRAAFLCIMGTNSWINTLMPMPKVYANHSSLIYYLCSFKDSRRHSYHQRIIIRTSVKGAKLYPGART